MQFIPNYAELIKTFTHLPVATQNKVNIGDAIQSVAARDHWGVYSFCDRNRPSTWKDGMVVPMHGWYSDFLTVPAAQVYLIGTHISFKGRIKLYSKPMLRDWLRRVQKEQGFPALCRDTSTRDFFRSIHVEAEFAGCISQTLPPWTGDRRARVINVDRRWVPEGDVIYQNYHSRFPQQIPDLLNQGEARLTELARASEVYTDRLHVFLPCRAIGTKVQLRAVLRTPEPHRFSGLVLDKEQPTWEINRRKYLKK